MECKCISAISMTTILAAVGMLINLKMKSRIVWIIHKAFVYKLTSNQSVFLSFKGGKKKEETKRSESSTSKKC